MTLPASRFAPLARLLALSLLAVAPLVARAQTGPPAGFVALFNGTDLTGWQGGTTTDPRKLAALPEAERTAQLDKWTATMKEHWRVENAELINDGKGDYATTLQDFGNFELLVEYQTVPLADSGIYLRGTPQVQIWDSTEQSKFNLGADKGSGGLWNNSAGSPGKDPLVKADKPFGEWNKFRIVMVGSRVSVWLNDQLVVDHATMENYFDKDRRTALPPRGPIQLQTHGGEIRWRNIFLREIGSEEATKILKEHSESTGFQSVFNGQDWHGWEGPLENYEIVSGSIRCLPEKGGTIYTKEEFGDFVARVEFKVPPGGNNGLAIRYPGQGDTAYEGFCESQVLDDQYEKVKGPGLDPRQVHGSVYGVLGAQRGYQHPTGEWNYEEFTIKGTHVKVELNGTVILDGDPSTVDPATFMAKHPHPGLTRTSGHFGFAGHNDPVEFRQVTIKKL